MKIALVSSKNDYAGQNIHRHIHQFIDEGIPGSGPSNLSVKHDYSHHEVAGRLIFEEGIDRDIGADLVLFLSRHSSVNPVPVLTVHVTGNFGQADLGGTAHTLAPAAPEWMQAILRELKKRAPPGYEVCYEVTHHGPTGLQTPSCFVEIGSTEKEWRDDDAGRAVAGAVLLASPDSTIPMISLGGTHYARRQTDISLKTQGAFGHIAHSREIPSMTRETICEMIRNTHAVAVHIDRKSMSGEDLKRMEALVLSLGLIRLGEHDLAGIGTVPWDHYLDVRHMAASFSPEADIRFHLLEHVDHPVRVEVDRELIRSAINADSHGFLEGLQKIPCIHLSTSNSPVLPVFITDQDRSEQLLHDLITLCVSTIIINEDTAVEGDYLVIRKKQMDPRKAREMGVPTGPLFGLLMKGGQVDIGGKTITPDMVQVCSERKIHIPGLEKYT